MSLKLVVLMSHGNIIFHSLSAGTANTALSLSVHVSFLSSFSSCQKILRGLFKCAHQTFSDNNLLSTFLLLFLSGLK